MDSSAKARLVTWTVYHRAYHPSFSESLPYVVGLVELEEGPRLFAGIVSDEPASLRVGDLLEMSLELREGGFRVPVFTATAGERSDHGD